MAVTADRTVAQRPSHPRRCCPSVRVAKILAMDSERIRRRLIVHGQVQGVWFRDSTRERAQAPGVAGWVRNRPDGAVESVLEGESEAVERVTGFLRTGPPRARVERVEVKEEPPEGLTGFVVR
jgi:acylphosphatase